MSGIQRKHTRYALLALAGVLVAGVLIVSARIIKSAAPEPKNSTSTSPPLSPTPATYKHEPVEVVRFTLYDAGIYPRRARVSKGLVAIMIEDLSGGTTGTVVERVNGTDRAQVGLVKRFEKHWRGREEIRLEPGNYEIYMTDRPNNRAQIVVEP